VSLVAWGIRQVEHGRVPDPLIRFAIRRITGRRRASLPVGPDAVRATEAGFVRAMAAEPIAAVPDKANEQHYEVPAVFFAEVLGPRRKYSSCLYRPGVVTLADAEEAALAETTSHAALADGQDVLELGCGWGSLSLWMAERFSASRITAVSNSASQRQHIENEARRRGLGNLRVVTADMNVFAAPSTYDRIVSVEMFEHMRNWPQLLGRVRSWLRPDGCLFLHVFAHRAVPYFYSEDGDLAWMARHFFSGGIMPSRTLVRGFPALFEVEDEWWWSGTHYQRTAEDWLRNLDRRRAAVEPFLVETYGGDAAIWFHRWRMFFLAVAEFFGYRRGEEWGVAHYRLRPTR
jgi:cyclopropane-fatty-acyl-phospholipid synthase